MKTPIITKQALRRAAAFLLLSLPLLCLQAQDNNYVQCRRMLDAGGTRYIDAHTYVDGLGRHCQEFESYSDCDTSRFDHKEYDTAGRESRAWLPMALPLSPAPLTSEAFQLLAPIYYQDDRPFEETGYEDSPVDRLLSSTAPGEPWGTHPLRREYLCNTDSMPLLCKHYGVDASGGLSDKGAFPGGRLHVERVADEDGHEAYTFRDLQGNTVLQRRMDGTTAHDTYYVRDGYGNLRYVLQPMFQEEADLGKFSFRYEYDACDRCVRKTLPGAEPVEYVYDANDLLLFSQNGNQREKGKWTYYLYDNRHRLTEQGECTNKDLATKTVLLQNYYDNYAFRSQAGFDNDNFPEGTVNATGYLTATAQRALGTDQMLHTAYYYDIKGRVLKAIQENILGGYDVTETVYTFTGNPQTVTHTHSASGKPMITEVYAYTYDHAERVTKVEHTLNGGQKVTLASYEYDDFKRTETKALHGNANNRQTYAYDLHGWLTDIGGDKFNQKLYYAAGSGTPAYNGNISGMTWTTGDEATVRGYKFDYDGLDRLKDAAYAEDSTMTVNPNRFNENVTSYDLNGNITGLQRHGQTGTSYGMVDNLAFTLDGNRLNRVDDSANGGLFEDAVKQTDEYAYDGNGNMTKDLNKNISEIEYNCLNLPSKVTFTDGSTIAYTYAADGTKLQTVRTINGVTTTTDYCGNAVYENGSPKYLLTEEGHVTLADKKYHYYLQDHQGNNRVVVDQAGNVEEVNHYYPFGGMFASTDVQPYKYNGKEYDKDSKWYDYGARNYDAALGRFTTLDPSAESYSNSSAYAYCGGNPVNRIDPTGADWYQNGQGTYFWKEGHEEIEGYTNLGPSVSVQLDEDLYLNTYQNIGVRANKAVNAFELIAASPRLQKLALGKNSPLSEMSKSELFNGLVNRETSEIGRNVGQFLVTYATGEFGGALLGKAIGWGIGKVAAKAQPKGFSSFNAFKKAYGPAGEGKAWHHIVEQTPGNIDKFGPERIHNVNNLIRLEHGKGSIHAKISGHYSSKPDDMKGLTVREWLKDKSFNEQYEFGIKILKQFGGKP